MEVVKIKMENIANYLDQLGSIEGINLAAISNEGWYQVGFKFGKSLFEDSDILYLDIVLSRKIDKGN